MKPYAIIGGITGHMHFTVARESPPLLEGLRPELLAKLGADSLVRCECGWSGRRASLAAHVKLAALGVRFR